MPHPIQVAVCGAGAFGKNHIRIYRELQASGFPVSLAAIIEPDPARAAAFTAQDPAPVFSHLQQCLAQVPIHAASVCVPTTHHHDSAAALLTAGVHVLVEKPITASLSQADSLLSLARLHNRFLQVGHLERFNPAVAALASRAHHPMFFEAHRLSVFSPRALDVDVVLDLMIHDLDIVLHLAQSPVREVRAVGLPVLSRQVDIANVRVEFDSGCVANFTASRVSTERVRKLRFFQPHQYVSVDYARQDLLIISVDPATPTLASPMPTPGLIFDKPTIIPGEPLRLEIESFLLSILNNTPPKMAAAEARDALALALQVQAAMRTHATQAGLGQLPPHP